VLHANGRAVVEIFQSPDQYLIPFFQRSYSWEVRHWRRLLDDIDVLYEAPADRQHFLGPLVCARMDSVPTEVRQFQLIDGQQRLTTLTLILCAFRDLANERGDADQAAEIADTYLLNKHRKDMSRYKVVPRIGDREAYRAIVEGKDLSPWRDLRVSECLSFFSKEFRKRFAERGPDSPSRVLRDVTARLGLVVITLGTENPYEIFESLNSTGLPLEQSDLVRNFVFMKVPLQEQDEFYEEHWRSFEARFGATDGHNPVDATDFYRDYLLREGVYLPARDTYVEFRDQNKRRKLTAAEQVADLNRFLGFSLWIHRSTTSPNPQIRERLAEFSRLDTATANPLVLELLSRTDDGRLPLDQFVVAMRDLSSFLIRRAVTGESTRAYGRWFVEAIKRIGADAVEGLRGYWASRGWPGDAEFEKRCLDFPIYRRESEKGRLILEKLEDSYGHKEKVDQSTLSIEHVLPQTLDEGANGAAWRAALGEDWFPEHQRHLHTLGNLTLTGYNSDMSNREYAVKRKALLDSNLRLNRYFNEIERWDVAAIQARGLILAKQLSALWPNPRQSVKEADSVPSLKRASKPNFDVEALRTQSLARLAAVAGFLPVQESEARYRSEDDRVRFVCLASQPYHDGGSENYWFAITPSHLAFLREAEDSRVALCCGSPDRILWFPYNVFLRFVEGMGETAERHWHVTVFLSDTLWLDQPKRSEKIDVGRYLLPVGAAKV
jgi:hypothetical protein